MAGSSNFRFGSKWERKEAMAKRDRKQESKPAETPEEEAGLREKVEIYLFLAVEILCLLLFVDFLFIGYYVK
jgi:Flp pilus assembly protein TadB